ncbi:hypothetical protein GINT2_001707 [Glugoides intestinalis]
MKQLNNKSRGCENNMLFIFFTSLALLCNALFLQQGQPYGYSNLLSSSGCIASKSRPCDSGNLVTYLYNEDYDTCSKKSCLKEYPENLSKNKDFNEFIKSYSEGTNTSDKVDTRPATLVERPCIGECGLQNTITITKREVKTVTVDVADPMPKSYEKENVNVNEEWNKQGMQTTQNIHTVHTIEPGHPGIPDVTVTRVFEKTRVVEKPITLFRELTTTVTREKPIINYRVTTFTEVSTKIENKTVTTTVHPENSIGYSQRTIIPPKVQEPEESIFGDRMQTWAGNYDSVQKVVIVTKTVENNAQNRVVFTTVFKDPSRSTEIKPSISIITVTVDEQSRTIMDTPSSISILTVTASRPESVSRAVAKGCEITAYPAGTARLKTICRFSNVPKDFLQQNIVDKRKRRRTVYRTLYKTERPDEDYEKTVTKTVYSK